MTLISIFPLLLLGFFVVLGFGAVAGEKLIAYEYKHHRKQWLKDGRPVGKFWWPKEIGLFEAGFLMFNSTRIMWLVKTPGWIKKDKKARRLLEIQKRCLKIWAVGFFVCLLLLGSMSWYQATYN